MSSSISRWTRLDHLSRIEPATDVLVVGGGITGAGTALDLAVRGARVTLVEQLDFAAGTSSRSTKLLHGGIRYLPHLEFGLVSEGLREQKVLARIADHLYEPLEFVIPLFRDRGIADAPAWAARGRRASVALRAGLVLYDALGGTGRPGRLHRRLDPGAVARMFPTVRPDGLRGGFAYSDGRTDDARLVLALLKTAVRRHGAIAVNRVRVAALEPRTVGYRARLVDEASGENRCIDAGAVVAATGPFPPPRVDRGPDPERFTISKGVHVLAPIDVLGSSDRALVLPETEDGRVLFVIPWSGAAMVGTTDTPYDGDLSHPVASEEDVEYLMRHVHRYLDVPELSPISAFAGLRALSGKDGSTARASREHRIHEPAPGYVQVAGGKLTTYRRIASQAADMAAAAIGLDVPSRSGETPLVGSGASRPHLRERLAAAGMPGGAIEAAIARHGTEAEAIARSVEEDPRLSGTFGDGRTTGADVVYAVHREAAVEVADVTLRRTRLAWLTPDHARADAEEIASLMAAALGWSARETQERLAAHEAELAAEGL